MSAITDFARDQSCVLCGNRDGTVVAAHMNGPLSAKLGRGLALKPSDLFCAHLCCQCHNQMDGRVPSAMTRDEINELWPILILLTQQRLLEAGFQMTR